MSSYDLLVDKSTRKILRLVRGLPDLAKLDTEAGGSDDLRSSRHKSRFTSHPRSFQPQDASDSTDDDLGGNGDRSSEVLVLKDACVDMRSLDSSDELCDVTLRNGNTTDSMNSIHAHLQLPQSTPPQESIPLKPILKLSDYKKDLEEKIARDKRTPVEPLLKPSSLKTTRFPMETTRLKPSSTHKSKRRVKFRREDDELRIYVDSKMTNLVERGIGLLQECKAIFKSGIQAPDGYEDYERRKRRTKEFSIRFSRNYLYQLNRNIVEIEALINPELPTRTFKSTSALLVSQKFFTAFQTISLALEAYAKHLPTSLVTSLPDKFRELIVHALKIDELYHMVTESEPDPSKDCVKIFALLCQPMLSPEFASTQIRIPNDGMFTNKLRARSKSRLAMYQVPLRKDELWKQLVAEQARKRYQVPSKYRTATFKHRPPVMPAHATTAPPLKLNARNKAVQKKSDLKLKKTASPIATLTVNDIDSNVTTFIEETAALYDIPSIILPDLRSAARKQLRNHALGFYNKVSNDQNDMTEHEYECILRHFLGIIGEPTPLEHYSLEESTVILLRKKLGVNIETLDFPAFVDKLVQYAVDHDPTTKCLNPTCRSQSTSVLPPTAARSTRSVTGRICDTVLEEDSDENAHAFCAQSLPHIPSAELVYLECPDEEEVPVERRTLKFRSFQNNAKGNKSKKGLIPLKMLAKVSMSKIMEYKQEFEKHCRDNCMYSSSGAMDPWAIIERVADHLMEEHLYAITQDLQIDEIVRQIYNDEFE